MVSKLLYILWCDWLRQIGSPKHRLHGFRWMAERMYKWLRAPVDKWRFQIPSAKLVAAGGIPVLSSQPVHSTHGSRWKPWQRVCRADIPQLSPKPLPSRHSLSGLPLSIWCQGPADCCPLSSIKAIIVEVTGACHFPTVTRTWTYSLAFMIFTVQFSITCQSWVLQ